MTSFKRYEKIVYDSHYINHIVFLDNYTKISVVNTNGEVYPDRLFKVIEFIRANISNEVEIYINDYIDFNNCHFTETVNFSKCIFEKEVIFDTCTFDGTTDFIGATFKNEVTFEKTKFLSNIRFISSEFKEFVNFENTVFEKLVDFYGAIFEKHQPFYRTDFLDKAMFAHVQFKGQVQFLYNKVSPNTIISFENATFHQSLDISRSNFWCKVQFWRIEINSIIPSEFWLYENDMIEDTSTKNKKKALIKIRESYRRIKQEFNQEGNNIEALKFHEYEMHVYKEEASISKDKIKWEDRTTLLFNECSNNFGSSWLRGLWFTTKVSLLFYTIFLLMLCIFNELHFNLSWTSASDTLKYFIQFLNITVWEYKPFGLTTYNGLGYLVFFIGRIFIGYGYYQTIQAFRKYKSN